MRFSKFIFSVLTVLLCSALVATSFGAVAGFTAFGLSTIKKAPSNSLMAGVIPEMWTDYIIGNLFKDNEFLLQSVDESQYVIGGSVVHIPQAGAPSGAKRNRTQLPATITHRKDVDVTYALDEITTDPRFIPNADVAQLSYDKLASCMEEDISAIKQITAESILYTWKPTFYIKTSGDGIASQFGTGNRKGVKLADIKAAKKVFDGWNIPKADRNLIIDTEMISQLTQELSVTTQRDYSALYDGKNGTLSKLEGFTIFERSTVLLASAPTLSAVSKKTYFKWTSTDLLYTPEQFEDIEAGELSEASTACSVALFYSKTAVARAMGSTKMFDEIGSPTYYGDIFSFLQRIGGRARRGDGKGVLGLIQIAA